MKEEEKNKNMTKEDEETDSQQTIRIAAELGADEEYEEEDTWEGKDG